MFWLSSSVSAPSLFLGTMPSFLLLMAGAGAGAARLLQHLSHNSLAPAARGHGTLSRVYNVSVLQRLRPCWCWVMRGAALRTLRTRLSSAGAGAGAGAGPGGARPAVTHRPPGLHTYRRTGATAARVPAPRSLTLSADL